MWSVGCVLLDLLSLTLPSDFKFDSKEREYKQRMSKISKGYSTHMKEVLKGLLTEKRQERWTAERLRLELKKFNP